MNYCTIEDAWGVNNTKTPELKETFEPIKNESVRNESVKKESVKKEPNKCLEYVKMNNCNNMIDHIKKCHHCYHRIKKYFKPRNTFNLTDSAQNIVNNNKDIIVLVLICISIMLFFNLINGIRHSTI